MTINAELPGIVIDCGSSILQGGFAGDELPQSIFSSCIGTPKYRTAMINTKEKLAYIGEEATQRGRRAILNLNYPIRNGIVKNWDLMDILLEFTFHELNLKEESIKDQAILFAEPISQPLSNTERLLEYSFEKYQVQGMQSAPQPILSVYASGRGSALSMCIGEGVTQVMPVYEGYTFPESIRRINFGGEDVTNYMIQLLRENQGMDFTNQRWLVEDMIKTTSYAALDYESEYLNSLASRYSSYELPDGQVLNLSHEQFSCSELLFNPKLMNRHVNGITDLFFDSIMSADVDTRKDLYGNLLLSGGPSMLPGLCDRLKKDMCLLCPPSIKIKTVAPPERKYSVWIGGSILASLSTFQQMWIDRNEYKESGPSIIHRNCYCKGSF